MSTTPLSGEKIQPKQQQRSFSTRQLGMPLLVLYYVAVVRLLSGMAMMLTVCKQSGVCWLSIDSCLACRLRLHGTGCGGCHNRSPWMRRQPFSQRAAP
jgi:hypothetical protein